jgi:hypothetical protein
MFTGTSCASVQVYVRIWTAAACSSDDADGGFVLVI